MKFSARRSAREYAVQAVYSWQISKNNISEIKKFFFKEKNDFKINCDIKYFDELISGVVDNVIYLDNIIKSYLFLRKTKNIGQIEKAILRISTFELTKKKDIPYKVIINEGIELAKSFGDYSSHKIINGLLDKIRLKIFPLK